MAIQHNNGRQVAAFGALLVVLAMPTTTTTTTTSGLSAGVLALTAPLEIGRWHHNANKGQLMRRRLVRLAPEQAAKADYKTPSDNVLHNNDGQQQQRPGMDQRLEQFIRRHLPAEANEASANPELAEQFDKVLRVLSQAGKLAHKLQYRSDASTSRQLTSVANEAVQPATLGRRAQGAVRRLADRLAKDWSSLLVKLAKVFLQFCLDLMLNDMFSTTTDSRRVSADIDVRRTTRDFLRLASGLPAAR